ncbi:MAG: hypothetical protein M1389_03750 [Chloroflexi bacterium]|nr:hypothetical protein [Chloroflexota bacterium]MCL5025337.1 hypothetical protein [Chloroflexota bacterium]
MRISEMTSTKSQLEASLRDLRRELEQTRKQVALLSSTPTGPEDRARASALLEKAQRTAIEVERRKLQIDNLNQQLAWAGVNGVPRHVADLDKGEEQLQADIAALRQSILASLRALARPMRRYEELVARKTNVTSRLADITHRDLSYANYVDCALVRRQEYDEDLRFVMDFLHKTRVVS